jgi:hypothetical protein
MQVRIASDAGQIGMDFRFYRDVGLRWLASGQLYMPRQLQAPYGVALMSDVLYPPPIIILFAVLAALPVPMAVALWWLIPIVLVSVALNRWRPRVSGVAICLTLLLWPRAIGAWIFGNSDIWIMAVVIGGLIWGWPGAAILLKPTFIPAAVLFVCDRRFWLGAIFVVVVSVPMLGLWSDYITAMANLRIQPDYQLGSLPLLLVPIVAWAARTRAPNAGPVGVANSAMA